jgi:cell division septation protein DedD
MSKPQAAQSKNAQAAAVKTVQPSPGLGSTKTEAGAPVALMVQVATLAHQEDADVLVEALKRRGYAVAAHRDTDGMVHVRVGPFDSRDVANQWRQKLMNDGYNAVVQGP